MSQKKNRIINKFLKLSGLFDKCKKWTDDKGKEHVITASNDLKRQYKNANYLLKTKLSKELR
jgi:hypothetical protein